MFTRSLLVVGQASDVVCDGRPNAAAVYLRKGRLMWFGIVYLVALGAMLLAVYELAARRLHHR